MLGAVGRLHAPKIGSGRRLLACRPQCSKGFGSPKKPASDGPDKKKSKRAERQQPQPAGQPQQPGAPPTSPPSTPVNLVGELEFEARLQQLAAEAEQRKQALAQKSGAGAGGVLDAGRPGGGEEDIYANPPPLAQTLFGGADEPAGREYEGTSFGPSQVALAVAALALVGVFLIANGGSELAGLGGGRGGGGGDGTAGLQLSEEQKADLEGQLAKFDAQLAEAGGDKGGSLEALEGAAVINARLGRYEAAIPQLRRLSEARPADAEVLRVLAETQAAAGAGAEAVETYKQAWEAGGRSSLAVLQGLSLGLVDQGKGPEAIKLLAAARQEGVLGGVEVRLLTGKAYAAWRGHGPDALRAYDDAMEYYPEDFRPPLAKGLMLRQQGRLGDAERYLLQAKYLAPKESRPAVDALIAGG